MTTVKGNGFEYKKNIILYATPLQKKYKYVGTTYRER